MIPRQLMLVQLLLVVILPTLSVSAFKGGVFLYTAFEQRSDRIQTDLIDTNTGRWIASAFADIQPRLTINANTDAMDWMHHRLAVSIISSVDGNKFFVFRYNSTSVWTEVDCVLPNELYCQCTVFANGRLFLIAFEGRFFSGPGHVYEYNFEANNGSSAEQQPPVTGFCNVTRLAENPYRVFGTTSGPRGQCRAIAAQSQLVWVSGRRGILYDYNNSSFTEIDNLASTFVGTFFDMIQDDVNQEIWIIHDNDPSLGNINTNRTIIRADGTVTTGPFQFPQVNAYTFVDPIASAEACHTVVAVAGLEVDWPSNTIFENGLYNATDGQALQSHPKIDVTDVYPDILPLTFGTGYDPTVVFGQDEPRHLPVDPLACSKANTVGPIQSPPTSAPTKSKASDMPDVHLYWAMLWVVLMSTFG